MHRSLGHLLLARAIAFLIIVVSCFTIVQSVTMLWRCLSRIVRPSHVRGAARPRTQPGQQAASRG